MTTNVLSDKLGRRIVPRKGTPRQATIRQMTDVEAAWMGAMLEGEGSVMLLPHHSSRKPFVRAVITNTDPEIMSACLRLTNAGRVNRGQDNRSSLVRETKICFAWAIQAWNDVMSFLQQVRPYSMKAQQLFTILSNKYGAPV